MEDRMIGLKVRENYECPGATLLIAAHRALEALVTTHAERAFKAFAPEGVDMALLSEVMSSAGVVRMFARIGEAFGEEKLVQPGGGGSERSSSSGQGLRDRQEVLGEGSRHGVYLSGLQGRTILPLVSL
jgi:hypothetical protein